MSDLIKVEVADGIQIITINRPEAKNAINLETAQAMAAALDQLDSRDDVRIGILTGAGGTFSSGMDLKAFAKSGQRPYVEGRGFAGLNEAPPKKPLIMIRSPRCARRPRTCWPAPSAAMTSPAWRPPIRTAPKPCKAA